MYIVYATGDDICFAGGRDLFDKYWKYLRDNDKVLKPHLKYLYDNLNIPKPFSTDHFCTHDYIVFIGKAIFNANTKPVLTWDEDTGFFGSLSKNIRKYITYNKSITNAWRELTSYLGFATTGSYIDDLDLIVDNFWQLHEDAIRVKQTRMQQASQQLNNVVQTSIQQVNTQQVNTQQPVQQQVSNQPANNQPIQPVVRQKKKAKVKHSIIEELPILNIPDE